MMETFLLGFVCSWSSAAIGWLGHRELVYRPRMRRLNARARAALAEAGVHRSGAGNR